MTDLWSGSFFAIRYIYARQLPSGDTQEGTVPDSGDAVSSTEEVSAPKAPDAGTGEQTPSAPAPVELPAELKDKYVESERYQNLETRLGELSKFGTTEEVQRLVELGRQAELAAT